LRGVVREGPTEDFVRCVEGEPEAEEVGEEQHPGEGEVGEVNEEGEDGGEDGEAKVLGDKEGVVGEEGGVEDVLDSGDVEAAVFCERVIALEEQGEESEGGDKYAPERVLPGRGLGGDGCRRAHGGGVHADSLAASGRYNEVRSDEPRQIKEVWDDQWNPREAEPVTREHRIGLLKTLPGLLISAFFLWWTFIRKSKLGVRPVNLDDFRNIHLIAPMWIAGVVLFSVAGYTVRSYRSWFMLRSVKARFYDCARVFMTSLAANNILPLRIGDVMRIFTYSGDLNATPSIIMSTVLLEKLLDVLTLGLMFVIAMQSGYRVEPHLRLVAEVCVALSFTGVLVLVLGARTLEAPVKRLFARTSNEKLAKVEHWILLAINCIRQIGVPGTLWLVAVSFVAWICEGMLYLSGARLVGLRTDWAGPWAAVSQANLSFLIPSSPGGIGPFEWACKDALIKHMPAGTNLAAASIFGLLIHAWLLVTITSVGGAMFFVHRLHQAKRKTLLEEIDTLPAELP